MGRVLGRVSVVMTVWALALPMPAAAFWNGDVQSANTSGKPAAQPAAKTVPAKPAGFPGIPGVGSPCAANVPGCPLMTLGSSIRGYCNSDVPLFSKENAQEFLKILGNLINEESKKHRELNKSLTENHAEAMRKLLIEYGAAQEVERSFGEAARTLSGCTASLAGPELRKGSLNLRGNQETAAADDRKYNLANLSEGQVLQRLLAIAPRDNPSEWRRFDYRGLFGDGLNEDKPVAGAAPKLTPFTLSEENFGRGRDYVQSVTAPIPMPQLPEELGKTPVGQKYEAARLLWQAEISAPQWVLNEILALHGASIVGGAWLAEAWKLLGYSGNPPQSVSKADYYQLMSMSRAGNNRWHNRVAGQLNEAGLLREMAMMQAAQLEMQRDQLGLLQHIAGLLAMERASEANRTTGATARGLLSQAIAQRAAGTESIPNTQPYAPPAEK